MEITEVVLVDEQDQPRGTMEKMEAHLKGELHRAFSIFIFNNKGEMLLQQRALSKYHSGGLWTNACCSHPVPGEEVASAARRRLREELNLDLPVEKVFSFTYKAGFDNGLTEYEYDHVFTARYDGAVDFNREEVMDTCYMSIRELKAAMEITPGKFTAWFRIAFPEIENWYRQQYNIKEL